MENNLVLKTFVYKNDSYNLYFDTLKEKIWVERKVLEELSKKSRIVISRMISHLIIDEIIVQSRNIKRISTSKKKTFLYDSTVLKEILPFRIYNQIDIYEKKLLEEFNKEHKKIYFKNGKLIINKYLINNILDIKLNVIDIAELFSLSVYEINNILKKSSYDIYDLISFSYIINNDESKEIKTYFSNILIKCIVDGYYINNDLCTNDKNKIINITKIADNILGKNKLENEEKRKYYKNTISYRNEIYESQVFLKKLFQKAKEEIIIISKFMDDEIFAILNNVCVKITLYASSNSLITKYNTGLFRKNHNITINKTYNQNNTYIIIDDDVYFIDISIINILKQNAFCLKKDIEKEPFLKSIKL